jgi:hypothetical protein
MATALKTFRERPLPASYETTAQPTFDLFGNASIAEMQFETVFGTLGGLELVHSEVPDGFYRFYQSMQYFHEQGGGPQLFQGGLVPNVAGVFPFVSLKVDFTDFVAPDIEPVVLRNFTVPPGARAAVRALTIGPGVRITANFFWVELRVGEPHGDIS